jgi:hypothetical protein
MVRPFGVAIGAATKEVIETTCFYTVKRKSSFLLSVHILQDFLSYPVLRSQTRSKNEVWFYQF